ASCPTLASRGDGQDARRKAGGTPTPHGGDAPQLRALNAIMPEMPPDSKLFRAEALEHYKRGRTDEGHLLEIEARWMRYADLLVIVVVLAAIAVFVV
ncbi:MAG TPA: hypothetical protein VF111_08980, partial [Thermoanaerobaculia bacterium]